MNVNDGAIHDFVEGLSDDFIEINKKEMTEKQKKDKKVSLYDYKSKLGKKLASERKKRKIRRNKFS